MLIFPAIDLYEAKAVRLFKGDYSQMTVYSENPVQVALDFKNQGATHMHIVDLEGAKSGTTPNYKIICDIKKQADLFCEVGGGIRSAETIKRYIDAGIDRVILGTAAVTETGFVEKSVSDYGDKIAVGVDIDSGFVAIKGWTKKSSLRALDFCAQMQSIGVKTLICTDISKDGAMQGANHDLYKQLSDMYNMQIIASGGVSSLRDIERLAELNLYGSIVGKAYYTGAVSLREAIEVAK